MTQFLAVMLGSLFDPLRVITAVVCGFLPRKEYAWLSTIVASACWTIFAHNLSKAEGLSFSGIYLFGAATSAFVVTTIVLLMRNKIWTANDKTTITDKPPEDQQRS